MGITNIKKLIDALKSPQERDALIARVRRAYGSRLTQYEDGSAVLLVDGKKIRFPADASFDEAATTAKKTKKSDAERRKRIRPVDAEDDEYLGTDAEGLRSQIRTLIDRDDRDQLIDRLRRKGIDVEQQEDGSAVTTINGERITFPADDDYRR